MLVFLDLWGFWEVLWCLFSVCCYLYFDDFVWICWRFFFGDVVDVIYIVDDFVKYGVLVIQLIVIGEYDEELGIGIVWICCLCYIECFMLKWCVVKFGFQVWFVGIVMFGFGWVFGLGYEVVDYLVKDNVVVKVLLC